MRRGLAYWIWAFFIFLCHNAFRYKKQGFLPRTPVFPRMSHTTFLCETAPYIEICYAYWGGGAMVPTQKFGLFLTAGDRTCGQVDQSIACQYSTSHTHTPQKQKNNNKTLRFRLQPILCKIVILECSLGKGAPWGMVLVANPAEAWGPWERQHPPPSHYGCIMLAKDRVVVSKLWITGYWLWSRLFYTATAASQWTIAEIELLRTVGWKWGCQPFSCPCSQNVMHCRKEIYAYLCDMFV